MKTIWTYHDHLPHVDSQHRISLGEGDTPLIKSKIIGPGLDLPNLYFKLENLNPTGSYKDRFASVFTSLLVQSGQKLCVATSSGNTGAALAAYSAAAQIKCIIVAVDGAAQSKIKQMQLYGAEVCMLDGFGIDSSITDDVFSLLNEFTRHRNIPLPVSAYCYCPDGMSGVETIAHEILDFFNGDGVQIFSPAGGGGLTLAIAKGVSAYQAKGVNTSAVHCVQPEGNNTIAGALRSGQNTAKAVPVSQTKVSGLQVPSVLDGNETLQQCKALNGNGFLVSDDAIFNAQYLLATREGIFCEPAGAVSLAGVIQAVKNNEIDKDQNIVCLVTGSGFKDLSNVDANFKLSPYTQVGDITRLKHIIENVK